MAVLASIHVFGCVKTMTSIGCATLFNKLGSASGNNYSRSSGLLSEVHVTLVMKVWYIDKITHLYTYRGGHYCTVYCRPYHFIFIFIFLVLQFRKFPGDVAPPTNDSLAMHRDSRRGRYDDTRIRVQTRAPHSHCHPLAAGVCDIRSEVAHGSEAIQKVRG